MLDGAFNTFLMRFRSRDPSAKICVRRTVTPPNIAAMDGVIVLSDPIPNAIAIIAMAKPPDLMICDEAPGQIRPLVIIRVRKGRDRITSKQAVQQMRPDKIRLSRSVPIIPGARSCACIGIVIMPVTKMINAIDMLAQSTFWRAIAGRLFSPSSRIGIRTATNDRARLSLSILGKPNAIRKISMSRDAP